MNSNERIHEIVWPNAPKYGMNAYNFTSDLNAVKREILDKFCKENVEIFCNDKAEGRDYFDCEGYDDECHDCKREQKISKIPAICEIIILLAEGDECERCFGKGKQYLTSPSCKEHQERICSNCSGTGRINQNPEGADIVFIWFLSYCSHKDWFHDFIHQYRLSLISKQNLPQFSITDGAVAVLQSDVVTFAKALREFWEEKKK